MTPTYQKVAEDGTVSLFCQAPGGHPAPGVVWHRAGRPISPDHSRYMIVTNQQSGVSALRIEPVRRTEDSGIFHCFAENELGEQETAYARIDVYREGTSETIKNKQKCL